MAKSYLISGIGFGDEGKGGTIDFLASILNPKSVVRYNGGSQAAHHVKHDQKFHCFSQFGSGTLNPGIETYLSRFMLVDPYALECEEEALRKIGIDDGYSRLSIDENCIVITPFQIKLGQIRELKNNYGSCGRGVGETVRDSRIWNNEILRIGDFRDSDILYHKLDFLWRLKLDQAEQIAVEEKNDEINERLAFLSDDSLVQTIAEDYKNFLTKINLVKDIKISNCIYEGAQGVLLDEKYGFKPYITKTNITFENALTLIPENESLERIGIIRAYSTRHGLGPFVSQEKSLVSHLYELDNKTNQWQGDFRVGWLDLVASRYAISILGGIDSIALTNLDKLVGLKEIKVCTAYEHTGKRNEAIFEYSKKNGKNLVERIKIRDTNFDDFTLAKELLKCKPVYITLPNNSKEYIDFLESRNGLGIPIKIVSEGQALKDKKLRGQLL